MQILVLLAAAALSIGVMAIFVGIGRIVASRDPSIRDRLDLWAHIATSEDTHAEANQPGRPSNRFAGVLNRLISRQEFASSLATELARANMPWTVSEYLTLSAVSVGVLFLLAWILTRQIVLAGMAGIVGWSLPGLWVRQRQDKRLSGFNDQLPNVLTLLVGTLRSGYGMTAALDTVAQQMPPPVSEEFGRVVREISLGLPAIQALRNLVRRVRSDDLDLVVTAVAIQYEVGGNLAIILETISETIRERVRLKSQLRTLTVQHRMTRSILTALPFILAGLIYLLNPEYMSGLFTPGVFLIIPIGSVVLIVLGWVLMGRLSKIEI